MSSDGNTSVNNEQRQTAIRELKRERAKIDARIAILERESSSCRQAKRPRQRYSHIARTQKNQQIQRAIHMLKTGRISLGALAKHPFPDLIGSCNFWRAFLREAKDDIEISSDADEVLRARKPAGVFSDKELVLQLCAYDPKIYITIPEASKLKSDRQVVEVALAANPFILASIPGAAQLQHTSLVGKALSRYPLWEPNISREIQSRLDRRCWLCKDVVMGWVKGGGRFQDHIPQGLRNDKEALFTAASSIRKSPLSLEAERLKIPQGLQSNKTFMIKMVERNPYYLRSASQSLKGCQDLAIAALSGKDGILAIRCSYQGFVAPPVGEERQGQRPNFRFWFQVANTIHLKLRQHKIFVELVLSSLQLPQAEPSNFAALQKVDEATAMAFTKKIVEYAGVPTGEELGRLRRARTTLATFGIRWSE